MVRKNNWVNINRIDIPYKSYFDGNKVSRRFLFKGILYYYAEECLEWNVNRVIIYSRKGNPIS